MREEILKRATCEMGSRAGKRRVETMTAGQRSEIARVAAKASAEVRTRKAARRKKEAA
jgi:hypothetical protein